MAEKDESAAAAGAALPAAEEGRAERPQRPPGRPFLPGNKAGAKGRPRADVRLKAALNRWTLEAARTLRELMRDPKTPRETKRKIAEYLIDRRLGRPVAAIGNPDGSSLLGPGAPGANPVERLLAAVRAHRDAQQPPEPQETTSTENAPPAASGAAGEGLPS